MSGDGSHLLSLKLPPVSVFFPCNLCCIYDEYRLGVKYFVEIKVI